MTSYEFVEWQAYYSIKAKNEETARVAAKAQAGLERRKGGY